MNNLNAKIQNLREQVGSDINHPSLLELIALLGERKESRAEARDLCFWGLNANPCNLKLRLLLARLFYVDGLAEFCVRELLEIKRYSDIGSLDRLLECFSDYVEFFNRRGNASDARNNSTNAGNKASLKAQKNDKTLAELEIDSSFIDIISEMENS